MFDNEKKDVLSKADKSNAGIIDTDIKHLVDKINQHKDYFTTSSCSGRIVITTVPSDLKKNEHRWLFVSHDEVRLEQIKEILNNLPSEQVWLRQEGFILHARCRTIENAEDFLKIAVKLGLKHSGIMSAGKRITVEIIASEQINSIIADNGKVIVDDTYLNILTTEANKRLKRTKENIKKIEKSIFS